MKFLYVLYDGHCELCRSCRHWLSRQKAYLELRFIALQSPEVGNRFPDIELLRPDKQLVVISDEGAVYRGASAWVMCLYALVEYRSLSLRLADPLLLPVARQACLLISDNRLRISRWWFENPAEQIRDKVAALRTPPCEESCLVKARRHSEYAAPSAADW